MTAPARAHAPPKKKPPRGRDGAANEEHRGRTDSNDHITARARLDLEILGSVRAMLKVVCGYLRVVGPDALVAIRADLDKAFRHADDALYFPRPLSPDAPGERERFLAALAEAAELAEKGW